MVEDLERGQRLREERERLGLSQTKLAAMCCASKGSQILYEKGKPPTADYLAALASAGADVVYVLTGERKRTATENSDRDRLRLAIEAVEEALSTTKRTMPPERKADLILAAYDLILSEPIEARQRVVTLLRLVA